MSRDAAEQADARFEQVVNLFAADPAVTPPAGTGGGFGASALKVDGKIFAMLSKGELVLKLPKPRVEELVASGVGSRFDPGHGRVMKEWVTIAPRHGRRWGEHAEEARQFVARTAAAPRRR